MKIIQIGQFPLSGSIVSGGVEASVYGLAREQAKTHSIVVIDIPRIGGNDAVEEIDGLSVYSFCNPGKHNKDAVKRIDDIVGKVLAFEPTICHVHGTGIFSCEIYNALKRQGVPLMLTVHGLVKEEKRKALKNRFSLKTFYQFWIQTSAERDLLQLASNVIVDTQYVAEQIDQYHLASRPKISVIPQGIDEQLFNVSCSPLSKTILSVGAFSKRKGHLLLIMAFEKIAQKIPDATLTICGVVSDKEYFNEVMNYVNASYLKDRISILTNLPKEQLLAQYEKARVFALHSQEESQGIVFAEAMAVGLPVVATRVGGIPDVICDGKTGFLAEYSDNDAFADTLEKLLTSDILWNQLSASCRDEAKHYSWNQISEKVEKVYSSILSV